MNRMESEVLSEKLEDLKIKLGKTITQIQLIENNLRDMNQRIRRASTNKKNSFRYNLKMKSSITGGVKIMYRLYLTRKAEEVRLLEQELAASRRRDERIMMNRVEVRQQVPHPVADNEQALPMDVIQPVPVPNVSIPDGRRR